MWGVLFAQANKQTAVISPEGQMDGIILDDLVHHLVDNVKKNTAWWETTFKALALFCLMRLF